MSGKTNMQPGQLDRIFQDVYLGCSTGWRYQEVDLELVLKGSRIVHQEKKWESPVLAEECVSTKVYSKW